MNFKRFLSVLLTLVMIIGIMPCQIVAIESRLAVKDNVVDISDKEIYKYSSVYYAGTTNIKVSGATVREAYEDGTTVYIVLGYDTVDNAEVGVVFGTSLNRCTVEGTTGSLVLEKGEGLLSMTLKGVRSSSKYATVTYELVFLRQEPPTEAPSCIAKNDSKDIYKNTSITLKLSDYFENALYYYLVDDGEKILIDGGEYTFKGNEPGVYTLMFSAANIIGECPDNVVITINVSEIVGGVWLGHSTSNGSLDFVIFKDADGNLIDGIETSFEEKNITVNLPKYYPIAGEIKAEFSLTQNESGYPFLSTKTATAGTSSNQAVGNKFTSKTTTLNAGAGNLIFYYFNSAPNGSNQETFKLIYKIKNDKPVLADRIEAVVNATITAGENYTLDLSPIFTDIDNDELTYKVSINGASAAVADKNYTFTTDVAGTYTLVFTANDKKDDSDDTYTVILTVENSEKTDSMTVYVPDGLNPQFYVSSGFADGVDVQGDILDAAIGETEDGLTAYTLNYPVNADMLSIRTEEFGGMAFTTEKDKKVTFRKVQILVVDYDNNHAMSTNVIAYGENTAASGNSGWLLVTDKEYTFNITPENADLSRLSKTIKMESGDDIYIVQIMLGIENPMSITVPTGATAQLYKYNKYYDNTELDAKIIKDNNDGTTTYQFIADTKANGSAYIYRVSMEGKITKSGWLAWNQQNLTINYTENDKHPSYRLDDYSMTGEENSSVTEDSVLLNGNSRNHINLTIGQSKTLKAYRGWEIIPVSYNNYIITPDFTYTVLVGNDVVSLSEKDSPSAGEGDWMTLTVLKEGIAIIEVAYDAIEVSGGSFDGVYGASDPNRSGLLIVQVGENDDASVKFGIDGFTSIGTSGSENITYNPNKKKDWDAEFDTLYFTGNSGELTFTPTASSELAEVSVSYDKGATWINLSGEDGVYNAEIVQGNNIIRVKTANGTAYQVVRGDKVTVKFAEVEGKSNDNGIVEAGETIRVTLVGLHSPIPKMAGNYNPGYAGNYEGYNSLHLNYTCNKVPVYGKGAQYNFITTANFVEVVIPDDGKDVTLCDGYIGLGVIGLTEFVNGGDSHRNIPDNGCVTRGSSTTYHTRSILPEITVSVGDTSAPNNAPIVRKDAVSEKEIYNDQNFAINPDTLFVDADGDALTFTVSVNGAEAIEAPLDYKFTPNNAGIYTLLFTATDGKATAEHSITLTVTSRPSQGGGNIEHEDEFGLSASEIAGYVTISFTDNGVRVKDESGLKYPKALGTIIKATKVPYKKGEKITHVTKRLLDHLGIRMSYTGNLESGFYLGAICDFELNGTPYDSFGEFDAGVGSGWMITLNKKFIEYGASEFKVKNGDVIKWQYTCQLGKDIGDPFYSGSISSSVNNNNKTEDKNKEKTEEQKNESTEEKEEKKEEALQNTFTETTFDDVKKGDWHYESVKYVYENNLMQGTDNGFEPESKMSRAMLVTVLFRMAKPESVESTHNFKDVGKGQWYSDAVAWAAANGIVSGITSTEFAPDRDISREQMALIIYRFAKMQGYNVSEGSDLSNFADTSDVSTWAYDAVKWANKTELVNGTSETTLSPKATATRAQVAAILMRFCENVAK